MRRNGFLCICACVFNLVQAVDPEVETTSGRIRGYSQTISNKNVNTYLGIPFAEPPVNDLRFKRPEPVKNWTETLECKTLSNCCPQTKFTTFVGTAGEKGEEQWNYNTNISEDCLYLNLWVPSVSTGSKLTTLIWIYGGAFIYGSSTLDIYNGAYLAGYSDVIIASMNYRLGPFGFLYMGDDEAPGNVGLMDQTLALKWIYDNIERFGGSKDLITVFGESAGAASVTYLMASEFSRNYFQRAIIQSASFLGTWAYQPPEIAMKYTKQLAEKVKCGSGSNSDIIRCLKKVSENELTLKQWDLNMTHVQWPFVPTLDNYFIHKSPSEILKTDSFQNKDLMFGFNKDEGSFFLLYFLKDIMSYPSSRNLTWDEFLSEIPYTVSADAFSMIDPKKDKLLFDSILLYYNAWSADTTKDYYFDILDDIAGDYNFKCPVVELAERLSRSTERKGTLYGYYFDQRTSVSDFPIWAGVQHGDEIEYIFGVPSNNGQHNLPEKYLSREMMERWTNFAKTGHPGVQKWKQFTWKEPQYGLLKAGLEGFVMQTIDYSRTCQFWSEYIPRLKETYSKMNLCVNFCEKQRISMHLIAFVTILTVFISRNP